MAAVTEGLSGRPSQIKPLLTVLIAKLSVKVMASHAYHAAPAVQNHIWRDLHVFRHSADRMVPHRFAVVSLMTCYADIACVTAETGFRARKGKMHVAIEAAYFELALMGGISR